MGATVMEESLEFPEGAAVPKKSTPRRHRSWIGVVVVLAAAGVLGWWWLQLHPGAAPVPRDDGRSAPAISVSTRRITRTTVPTILEATGVVQPEMEAPIAAKVVARVQSVLVKEGDRVQRGQRLILLDAQDLEASIAQANANLRAARVGYDTSRVAARMESSLSTARIGEAQSKVNQSEAALRAAAARQDLIQAGPRPQEREQALLAVSQAKSTMTLAESNLKRMANLYREGAISAQQYDQYRSQFEVAKSQFETAQQGKSISDEGSRAEDIKAAMEAVRQAEAAVQEAKSGLKSAIASAMQAEVRTHEIQGARAQVGQSQANLRLAEVAREYAVITSPFDGIVTKRSADPGALANPGTPLITIIGGSLRLEAIVPESALAAVRNHAAIPVHFDALHNRPLIGRVVEIAPQGDASSHTFLVKINLPGGSGVSPGMFGRARFTTGMEQRFTVPVSAVSEREGLSYLYVVDGNHLAHLRMVTIGDPIGGQVPILSGLNSGERIVVASKERVTDGSTVSEGSR